jgi:hypothetical protein
VKSDFGAWRRHLGFDTANRRRELAREPLLKLRQQAGSYNAQHEGAPALRDQTILRSCGELLTADRAPPAGGVGVPKGASVSALVEQFADSGDVIDELRIVELVMQG